MQACGLKLGNLVKRKVVKMSRLMQACGLKLQTGQMTHEEHPVTPHAGVWIETKFLVDKKSAINCHASCRRVD